MPTDCHVNVTAEINRLQSDKKKRLCHLCIVSHFMTTLTSVNYYYNATWILVLGAWSLFLTEVIYV